MRGDSLELAFFLATQRELLAVEARQLIRLAASQPDADPFELFESKQIAIKRPMHNELVHVAKELAEHDRIGVRIIPIFSPLYPKSLRLIPDAPPILYARGNIDLLQTSRCLAVVGTRKASNTGLEVARRVAAHFASADWCIVSGLALGIDAAAHTGALHAKGKTIAVLAHGLHMASPPNNRTLADSILDSGGLWVSEHAAGRSPKPHFFKERNRIQTALSVGSIIVEGEPRSGSMAQARFCLEQGRLLFAVVPHSVDNPLGLVSSGTSELVRFKGAIPIRGRGDYGVVSAKLEHAWSRGLDAI